MPYVNGVCETLEKRRSKNRRTKVFEIPGQENFCMQDKKHGNQDPVYSAIQQSINRWTVVKLLT